MSTSPVIVEYNSSGEPVARYTKSAAVALPTKKLDIVQKLFNLFLPAGFPGSVTEDYVGYQVYDSLQAFSSSIAGLLSSRAVLQGFGVGDANASATSAMLLTVVQECVGRLATIAFAHKFGLALEADCKRFRLLADIFNDSGMILDCLSPVFPGSLGVVLLCLSGSLKAMCGVAGGATKASLSVHFATTGNVGELNAKDSSQETVISLLGMLTGSLVVSCITSTPATWAVMMLLVAVHLATNYKAVSSVSLNTLNRHRTNILCSHYFCKPGAVLTPKEVARRERVLERGGLLRWRDDAVVGTARAGVRFATAVHNNAVHIATAFRNERFVVCPEGPPRGKRKMAVFLKDNATPRDAVKAWCTALLVAKELADGNATKPEEAVQRSLRTLIGSWSHFVSQLEEKGWDLDATAIVTRANAYRITVLGDDGRDFEEKKLL